MRKGMAAYEIEIAEKTEKLKVFKSKEAELIEEVLKQKLELSDL